MDALVFRSFVKEAMKIQASNETTPPEYLATRAAVMQKLGMTRTASMAVPALEVGGLGVLARPSYQTLKKPGASDEEKSHAKHELAGLGILAAHPAHELGTGLAARLRRAAPMAAHAL